MPINFPCLLVCGAASDRGGWSSNSRSRISCCTARPKICPGRRWPTTRGIQLEVRNYERALREADARADVDIHPHQLRNNFAKYYILNGGDWFMLSRIVGHSSVEVTQKAYLDFMDEEVGQKNSPLEFLKL